MFINAELRHVSNGCFEAFVHRSALHRRLAEMTNNDLNAWNGFRPMAPQANDSWDEHFSDFDNENFPAQTAFDGYLQDAGSQSQDVDLPKPSYPIISNSQYTYYKGALPHLNQAATNMNCVDKPSPMLGNEYSTWNLGHGRGSFAEFSGMQNVLKDFTYQPLMGPVMPSFSAVGSSSLLQSSYLNDGSVLSPSMTIDKTSPGTVYGGGVTSSHSIDPGSLSQYEMSNSLSSTRSWWPESIRNSNNPSQGRDMLVSHDGLPGYQMSSQPQHFNELWIMGSNTSNAWPSHDLASNTISPKALTLNITSAPLSVSGSSQESVLQISDSSSSESSEDDQSNYSSPESLEILPPQPRRLRQILPNSGLETRRILPASSSNGISLSETTQKQPTGGVTISASNVRRKYSPPPGKASTKFSEAHRSTVHKRIEPKPADPSDQCGQVPATAKASHYRDAKDDFLVRSKLAGMSYKDIRKKGKFTEAESTLRGRFRTLTKHKTARVRKPEWNDNDVQLLKKAVRKLTKGTDSTKCKVPWKQVAEYISENGGSYHFGNATCRKRWDELQAEA